MIPGLPKDIGLHILALLPCTFHATFTAVCKEWKRAVTSGQIRGARDALGLLESRLYVFLENSKCAMLHLHRYDFSNKQWSKLNPLPWDFLLKKDLDRNEAPNGFTALPLGNCLYVIGGFRRTSDGLDICLNDVYSYDILQNSWSLSASMILPRFLFASGIVENKILVAGGLYFDEKSHVRERTRCVEIYHPDENCWRPLPDSRLDRLRGPDFGLMIDDRFTIVSEDSSSLAEAFDLKRHDWIPVSGPPIPDRVTKVVMSSSGILCTLQNLWPIHRYRVSARDKNGTCHILADWGSETPGPVSHARELVVIGQKLVLIGNEHSRAVRKRHTYYGRNPIQIATFNLDDLNLKPHRKQEWHHETTDILPGSWVVGCAVVDF